MPTETPPVAKLRRRLWPRFTLRVLLFVVTSVGIALGYWTHRARQQQRIVGLIEAGGGSVYYEHEGPLAPRRSPVIAWLAESLGRDYVEDVVEAPSTIAKRCPKCSSCAGGGSCRSIAMRWTIGN